LLTTLPRLSVIRLRRTSAGPSNFDLVADVDGAAVGVHVDQLALTLDRPRRHQVRAVSGEGRIRDAKITGIYEQPAAFGEAPDPDRSGAGGRDDAGC
jgi:hypothetical protein